MKLTYDPRYNIAYIRLRKKPEQAQTIRISEGLNVDLGPDGAVYGIELLNANEQLFSEDNGKLLLVNEEAGESKEIPLTGIKQK